MTLEELKDWVYELEDEIEKKVETIAHHNEVVETINQLSWDSNLNPDTEEE